MFLCRKAIGDAMDSIEKAERLRGRTKQFSLRVIHLYQHLPGSDEARIIGKQLLRSATSVAANYRAACRARSDREFYAKMCIVVEEADETEFWIDLLRDAGIVKSERLINLHQEAMEILKIMSKSRKTAKENFHNTK